MRLFVTALLLGGCVVPESSTFVKLDASYIARPSVGDIEIYVDGPPPRKFRIVGTIRLRYVADEGSEPILAAQRARQYGCDLVTTHLAGAVAGAEPGERPLFHRASWFSSGSSGSSGGSGGSWGRSSGGSSGGGYGSGGGEGAPLRPRRVYYCGIYLEPPALAAPDEMI